MQKPFVLIVKLGAAIGLVAQNELNQPRARQWKRRLRRGCCRGRDGIGFDAADGRGKVRLSHVAKYNVRQKAKQMMG